MNRSGKYREKFFDFLLIDIIAANIAITLAYTLVNGVGTNLYMLRQWRSLVIILSVFIIIIANFGNNYSNILRRGLLIELLSVAKQTVIWELLIAFYLYLIHMGRQYSRTVILLTGVFSVILGTTLRSLWKNCLRKKLLDMKQRIAILGPEAFSATMAHALERERYSSNEVALRLPCTMESMEALEAALRDNELDYVIIDQDGSNVFARAVQLCQRYGCRISVVPSFSDMLSVSSTVTQIGDIKLLNFRVSPLEDHANQMIKRLFDLVLASLILILTSPILALIAIGIKLSSPGPVLFKQQRVGQYRKTFTMYKFRSMQVNATETTGWSKNRDPRKTRFGAMLRKLSLDELPQMINVLMGTMSIVGPRPEVPYHVEHFTDEIPMYLTRQQVKPGITGWAQIHGYRGDTDISKRVKYDLWYIENWSLSLDIKIVIKTIFGGMVNREEI